jgi:hypothetical protein
MVFCVSPIAYWRWLILKSAGGGAKSAGVVAGGGVGRSAPYEICHQMCVSEICDSCRLCDLCGALSAKNKVIFFLTGDPQLTNTLAALPMNTRSHPVHTQ